MFTEYIAQINTFVATGILLLQIGLVALLLWWFYDGTQSKIIQYIGKRSLGITFVIALAGMLTSLFYSDVIGYAPCTLCWFQRIFLYPQVFILALALWKKDRSIALYSLVLSSIGFLIALYHRYVEISGHSVICVNSAVSCSKIYVNEYGYITIPIMALTSFAAMFIIMFIGKKVTR